MISYKNCKEVSDEAIYQAFQSGFSDYMIKFDIPREVFIERFFGAEGNSREYSFIAFDDTVSVGLILGGMKIYEGIKTLRCGTLCIHPDYRRQGIAAKLFDLHKGIALENNCKQLFLEVIRGNDRAIRFYEKNSYEKVYELVYFSHGDPSAIRGDLPAGYAIQRVDFDEIKRLEAKLHDIHVNWQNDFDYIARSSNHMHFGLYRDGRLAGGLSITGGGKISLLWVNPEERNKGLARALLCHVIDELQINKLAINFPNNAGLTGFVRHLNFSREALSQYEMYFTL